MVERVEVPAGEGLTNTPADNTDARPQWLPDKFASAEEMAKSYAELEREYTKLRQSTNPEATGRPAPEAKPTATGKPDAKTELFDKPKTEENKPEDQKPATLEDVQSILPGFTEDQINEFSQTAWENGKLTDDQYKALADKGYSRDLVDQYIQGQLALVESQRMALINAGGGEQAVTAMFDWAAANLSAQEIDNYNAKFQAGGPDALMAMEHLKSRFVESGQAFGFGNQRVNGANSPSGNVGVYTSVAQVTKDMQSPEYRNDPAFRKMVAEKIARSNVL